ncbi:DUF965-domain-containing protein [Rhizophagus irregularis]|uniref:DUF965-domain-containing protein n=1 Tax=Rhizophagus irregularis TaxID=588596 RepID=A0A2N0QI17_9GLOM|nr:DUF965-domain-containing protein [Rhizophagus irregularis]
MKFSFPEESMEQEVKQVMLKVYSSLEEKGYNPTNQIVGYLLSGDPAYIPRHQDARNLIRKLERDEILEELVKFYIRKNNEADALGWTAQGIETIQINEEEGELGLERIKELVSEYAVTDEIMG